MSILLRVDRAVMGPGPSQRLLLAHRLLAAALTVRLLKHRWWQAGARPDALFEPVWIISWLGRPPSTAILVIAQVIGVVAGIGTVIRRAPRIGFVLVWSSLVFLAAVWGSSGKVMHNDLLLITVATPMLFTALPSRDATSSTRTEWGWAPRAALILCGLVYLATGVQKLRHSGLAWVTSDNMAWVVRQGSSIVGPDLNASVGRHVALLSVVAGTALAVELAVPVLLAFRRTRILVPMLSFTMHASIWALLGLDYSAWVLAVFAVTMPFVIRWDTTGPDAPWWRRLDLPWRLTPPHGDALTRDGAQVRSIRSGSSVDRMCSSMDGSAVTINPSTPSNGS